MIRTQKKREGPKPSAPTQLLLGSGSQERSDCACVHTHVSHRFRGDRHRVSLWRGFRLRRRLLRGLLLRALETRFHVQRARVLELLDSDLATPRLVGSRLGVGPLLQRDDGVRYVVAFGYELRNFLEGLACVCAHVDLLCLSVKMPQPKSKNRWQPTKVPSENARVPAAPHGGAWGAAAVDFRAGSTPLPHDQS